MEHFNKWGQVVDCYFPGCVNFCSHSIITPAFQTSSLRHIRRLTAATACRLRMHEEKLQEDPPWLKGQPCMQGRRVPSASTTASSPLTTGALPRGPAISLSATSLARSADSPSHPDYISSVQVAESLLIPLPTAASAAALHCCSMTYPMLKQDMYMGDDSHSCHSPPSSCDADPARPVAALTLHQDGGEAAGKLHADSSADLAIQGKGIPAAVS